MIPSGDNASVIVLRVANMCSNANRYQPFPHYAGHALLLPTKLSLVFDALEFGR
jgi:hypothetical protein